MMRIAAHSPLREIFFSCHRAEIYRPGGGICPSPLHSFCKSLPQSSSVRLHAVLPRQLLHRESLGALDADSTADGSTGFHRAGRKEARI